MILNMSGGGPAATLNFKVLGGTEAPSNPSKNTIWVNTDVKITSWLFSVSEPTDPVDGMVWFVTSVSSPVEFNALKKNGIQVYPISAKQYISGTWVEKTAKSYLMGSWKEWATYLYNAGSIVEQLRFMGRPHNSTNTLTGSNVTITYNSDNITIYNNANSHAGGFVYFPTKVDLSQYKTLTARMSISSPSAGWEIGLGVYSSLTAGNMNDTSVASAFFSGDTSMHDYTIDVSSLSGEYYICFVVYGSYETFVIENISLK